MLPYEARERKDEQRIAEAEKRQEQAVATVQRHVQEVAGSKIIVKEDPDTGHDHQTKIGGGSWSR